MSWKIVTGVMGFSLGCLIIYLVRHDHLRGLYGVWWFLLALMSIFFGLFPGAIDYIGKMLGVYYPPILLMVGALVVLFAVLKRALLEQAKTLTKDLPHNQEDESFLNLCLDDYSRLKKKR